MLQMYQDSLQTLSLGAMLLDIGKTKIPDEILNKNEELTEKEIEYLAYSAEHYVKVKQMHE